MSFKQLEDLCITGQLVHGDKAPWSSSTWKQQDGFDMKQLSGKERGGVPQADICQSSRPDGPQSLLNMSDQKLWESCLC